MSRDALDHLLEQIPRLLFMGAGSARADAEIEALVGSLDATADVPAVAALRGRLERLRGVAGHAAAEELLGVAAAVAQIGGARARPAAASGQLAPLPVYPGVHCDDDAHVVERKWLALRSGRVPSAGDSKLDLRLIGPWVDALGSSNAALQEAARSVVLRAAGLSALAFLRDSFRLSGGAADGRRLEVLAELEPHAARALVDEAFAQGSMEVRASALRALSRVAPAEAESRATAILAEPAGPLFEAACGVLAGSSSDAALRALLERGTSAEEAVAGPVLRALGTSRDPRAGAALLAMIPAEIATIREATTGYSRGFSSANAATFERFSLVARALQGHMDRRVCERLRVLATDAASMPVRRAARTAMLESGSTAALEVLVGMLRPGESYQDEGAVARRAITRGDLGVVPALRVLVDKLDKADRELVYLGLIKLDARSEIPWLKARSRLKGLHEREHALVRQALAALEDETGEG